MYLFDGTVLGSEAKLMTAILRLGYFPSQWKVATNILIPKPGKDLTEISAYRPISLLPIISKVFQKLFIKMLMPLLEEKNLI